MLYRKVMLQWGMENPTEPRNRYIESTTVSQMLLDACAARKRAISEMDPILRKLTIMGTAHDQTYMSEEYADTKDQKIDEDVAWITECVENASLIAYGFDMRYGNSCTIDRTAPFIFFGNTVSSIRSAMRQVFKNVNAQFNFSGFLYNTKKSIDIPVMTIDEYLGVLFTGRHVEADNIEAIENSFVDLLSDRCCPIRPSYHSVKYVDKTQINVIAPWCCDTFETLFDGSNLVTNLMKLQISVMKSVNHSTASKEVEIVYFTNQDSEKAYIGTDQFCKAIAKIVLNSPYIIYSSIDLEFKPNTIRIFVFDNELDSNDWLKQTKSANSDKDNPVRLVLGAWMRTSCVRCMGWPAMSLFMPDLVGKSTKKEEEKERPETDHDNMV